ncbi:MAG: hypothetical protein WKF54_01340 [Nocardioidaceae bacterium]
MTSRGATRCQVVWGAGMAVQQQDRRAVATVTHPKVDPGVDVDPALVEAIEHAPIMPHGASCG